MSCYHPIPCWYYSQADPRKLFFTPPPTAPGVVELTVPCRQCIGCRLDYSRQWATRIYHESLLYSDNYFVTLTYAPESLPIKDTINLETGELVTGNPLVPEHLTKFMKDLRRYWSYHFDHDNVRFYGVGEYGENTGRPHLHICIFNLPHLDDLIPFFTNKLGQQIYLSPLIETIWSKGQVSVGAVTWQSAAYVARYMLKKQKGKDAQWFYDSQAITSEFVRMSRRPGIGFDWYAAHKDSLYPDDSLIVPTLKGAMQVKPPAYYDRLFDLDHPEVIEAVKAARLQSLQRSLDTEKTLTSLNHYDTLAIAERSKQEASVVLLRKLDAKGGKCYDAF